MRRLNRAACFPHLCHGQGCAVCYWLERKSVKDALKNTRGRHGIMSFSIEIAEAKLDNESGQTDADYILSALTQT